MGLREECSDLADKVLADNPPWPSTREVEMLRLAKELAKKVKDLLCMTPRSLPTDNPQATHGPSRLPTPAEIIAQVNQMRITDG